MLKPAPGFRNGRRFLYPHSKCSQSLFQRTVASIQCPYFLSPLSVVPDALKPSSSGCLSPRPRSVGAHDFHSGPTLYVLRSPYYFYTVFLLCWFASPPPLLSTVYVRVDCVATARVCRFYLPVPICRDPRRDPMRLNAMVSVDNWINWLEAERKPDRTAS